jgi:hypothetical protein
MDYVVVSGASRKNEKWEHVEGETVSVAGKSEAEKLATDAMYRLEHGAVDKKKADDEAPRLARIIVRYATSLSHDMQAFLIAIQRVVSSGLNIPPVP